MNAVTYNKLGLTALRKQLALAKTARAHVGLFKESAMRVTTEGRIERNPDLGFEHEFGNLEKHLPERSFLRMPLLTKLTPKRLAEVNWIQTIRKRGLLRALKLLGTIGEEVVQEAFATRGFGMWQELHPRTIRRKGGSTAILIETNQMRNAITSRVVP